MQGCVKLADFGCSKTIKGIVSQGDMLNTLQGTPFWMAPEVIKQSGRCYPARPTYLAGHGPPADVWSFGCTMIEMADGNPPFSEYTLVPQFFYDILMNEKTPKIPEHLSPEGQNFTSKCLTVYGYLEPLD